MVEPEPAILRRLRPPGAAQVVAVDPVENRLGEGLSVVRRPARLLEQGREHLLRRQVHVDPAVHVHRDDTVAPISEGPVEFEQQSGGQESRRRSPAPSRDLRDCEPAIELLGGVGDTRLGGVRGLQPAPLVGCRQDVEVGARQQRAAQQAENHEEPEHRDQRYAGLPGPPRPPRPPHAHGPARLDCNAVRVTSSSAPAPGLGHVMRTRISIRRCSPTGARVTT